ncbi:DUF3592 domain-containing protein [Hymenobacter sp. J193]|uniref:DUF3592 domain-containing protein n=1 Tax=Hymenobacter sp. J193 TaxID=2898429 RepID=UPI002150E4FA|nr:DUF3592 domain-containing protein [Hymenobacter sp. J193]MCR5886256.1 DUF3592 domain-containing protein [Hymenobacter sp. J193]
MPARPAKPAYQQRQQERRQRHAAAQKAQPKVGQALIWLLVLVVGMLAGAGLLFYRSTRPMADLTRLDGVLEQVAVQRASSRSEPYTLRFTLAGQPEPLEVYLGQSEELAADYRRLLHVGDSVRVYYNRESAPDRVQVYQLEKQGQVLLSYDHTRTENQVGAVAFGLLGLLPIALLLANRHVRTALKPYFRRRTA